MPAGMETSPQTPAQRRLVIWVLWSAFLVGCCLQYLLLHSKQPPVADGSKLWLLALVPIFISVLIRWNMIPRITHPQTALVALVIGVALAEGAMFVGIFVFSAHQWEIFLAAILGIAQHAPAYAGRLSEEATPGE